MTSLIGLGRRHAPDSRDKDYLLPKRRAAAKAVTARMWFSPGVLDQGATSQCVAYAGTKYLTSHPIVNKAPMTPAQLYKECQKVDEWPGEDYDGTSVRALFKVLKSLGYITEYRWGFDLETVVNHVLTTGPVVMGTSWDMEMSWPDRSGYVAPGPHIETEEAGHAWTIIGANRKRPNPDGSVGACRCINSWGDGWNQKGRFWISFKTLAKLIEINGEAGVATEIKRA